MPRKAISTRGDRRQRILEAALEVFAERGFEAATTKEIAERAEVNQGLIYFYFENKEEVFFSAFEYYAQQVVTQLDFTQEVASLDPPEVGLRRLIGRIMIVLNTSRSIKLLRMMDQVQIMPENAQSVEKRRTIGSLAGAIVDGLREYLNAHVERGTLAPLDTELAAHLMTRMFIAASLTRTHTYLAQVSLQQTVEMIVRLFAYGLLSKQEIASHLSAQ